MKKHTQITEAAKERANESNENVVQFDTKPSITILRRKIHNCHSRRHFYVLLALIFEQRTKVLFSKCRRPSGPAGPWALRYDDAHGVLLCPLPHHPVFALRDGAAP